jgi:hypothetical protein
MSAGNPRKDLDRVIELAEAGELPEGARRWAEAAGRTAEEILQTVRAMKKKDLNAPTLAQREALGNICAAARRWLKTVKDRQARSLREAPAGEGASAPSPNREYWR